MNDRGDERDLVVEVVLGQIIGIGKDYQVHSSVFLIESELQILQNYVIIILKREQNVNVITVIKKITHLLYMYVCVYVISIFIIN